MSLFFYKFCQSGPGSGFAFGKTAESGSAKNECGSTALGTLMFKEFSKILDGTDPTGSATRNPTQTIFLTSDADPLFKNQIGC